MSVPEFIRGARAMLGRRPGLILLAALAGLGASPLCGQQYLSEVDHGYSGTSYLAGTAEFGADLGVDGSLTIGGNLGFQSNSGSVNILQAGNIYLYTMQGNEGEQDISGDSSYHGPFQVWPNFNPGMIALPGAAASWWHASVDLGDLTYTGTDTPAFNAGAAQSSGGLGYPTINFTGYDAATTWTWQQDGLDAMANSTAPIPQMSLDANGNLALVNWAGNTSFTLIPQSGCIALVNTSPMSISAAGSSWQFSLDVANGSVDFYNGHLNIGASVSAANLQILSIAIGADNSATGQNSLAVGHGLSTPVAGSVVFGLWNDPAAVTVGGNVTGPIFAIGNGADAQHRANALTVAPNGDTTLNGNTTVNGNFTVQGTLITGNTTPVNFAGHAAMSQAQGDIPMAKYQDYP